MDQMQEFKEMEEGLDRLGTLINQNPTKATIAFGILLLGKPFRLLLKLLSRQESGEDQIEKITHPTDLILKGKGPNVPEM